MVTLEHHASIKPLIVSPQKIIILSLATFGIYEVYWFYRQWQWIKAANDLNVRPLVRAIFSPIFSYFLFKEVFLRTGTSPRSYRSPALFAFAYFILISLWKLPSPYDWLSVLTFIPLILTQEEINRYSHAIHGGTSFSKKEIAITIIGGLMLLLVLYATFVPIP